MATQGPSNSQSNSSDATSNVQNHNVEKLLATLQKLTQGNSELPGMQWLGVLAQLKEELDRLEAQAKQKAHAKQVMRGVHTILGEAIEQPVFNTLQKADQEKVHELNAWCLKHKEDHESFSDFQEKTEQLMNDFYVHQSYSITPSWMSDKKGDFFYYLNQHLKNELNKPLDLQAFVQTFPKMTDLLDFNQVTPPEPVLHANPFAQELQKQRSNLKKVEPEKPFKKIGLIDELKRATLKTWKDPQAIEDEIKDRKAQAPSSSSDEDRMLSNVKSAISSRRKFLEDSDEEEEAPEQDLWDSQVYTPLKDSQNTTDIHKQGSSDSLTESLQKDFKNLSLS